MLILKDYISKKNYINLSNIRYKINNNSDKKKKIKKVKNIKKLYLRIFKIKKINNKLKKRVLVKKKLMNLQIHHNKCIKGIVA